MPQSRCSFESPVATARLSDRRSTAMGTIAVVALLTLLLQLAVPAPHAHASSGFRDVDDGHPFVTEITWLVDAKLTTGFPDGRFRPTAEVSRQAAAAFLYRLAGEPAVSGEAGFDDVPPDHPFHDAIAWLVDEGITSGFPDNTFQPTRAVSRQAAAAFLHRYEDEPSASPAGDFSDVPTDHPFAVQISWMVQVEVASGFPNGTFRPADPVTRQAMSAFLYRLAAPPEPAVVGFDLRRVAASNGGWSRADANRCDGLRSGSQHVDGRLQEQALYCWMNDHRSSTHRGWVEYDLGRTYSHFSATVGQGDRSEDTNDVIRFAVYGDGRELGSVELPFGRSHEFELDVTNVLRLRLEVTNLSTDGDRGRSIAVWGNPTVS